MKYIFIVICLLLALLGCSNNSQQNETKPKEDYNNLLSEDKYYYSLYIVGDDITFKELDKNKITSVKKIIIDKDLNTGKKSYKSLNLTQTPTYILFNNKKIVYKTNKSKDLFAYLKKQK